MWISEEEMVARHRAKLDEFERKENYRGLREWLTLDKPETDNAQIEWLETPPDTIGCSYEA